MADAFEFGGEEFKAIESEGDKKNSEGAEGGAAAETEKTADAETEKPAATAAKD